MTQANVNPQTPKTLVPANQAPPQFSTAQYLTEQRIREVIIETLIELDLIPRTQKKKAIAIE